MNHQQQFFGRVDDVIGALSEPVFAEGQDRLFNRPQDRQYLQMHRAFARKGGMVSGTDVAHILRRHHDQPLSKLARWIVEHSIVQFQWRSHILVPLFQFDPADMSVKPAVTRVLQELTYALDDWEVAHWFAHPNSWLSNDAPVDAIDSAPDRVVEAARADRYIVHG